MLPLHSRIGGVRTFDTVIVGGGVIGAALAWGLARAGRRVVVLDRQQPGMEASWAAAGMLAPGAETPDSVPVAPLGRASLALYPEFVAAVEADCGMRVGYEAGDALQVFFGDGAVREAESFLTQHRELSMQGEMFAVDLARQVEPELSAQAQAVVLCKNEARVEPRALVAAVIAAAQKRGAEVRAECAVERVLIEGGRVRGVKTSVGEIAAECVVVAAGSWSGGLAEMARYAPTRPVRASS